MKLAGSSAAAALSACGADGKAPPKSPSSPGSATCQQNTGAAGAIPNPAGAIVAVPNQQQQNCPTVTPAPKATTESCGSSKGSGEDVDVASAVADQKYINENPFVRSIFQEIVSLIQKHPPKKLGAQIVNKELDNYVASLLNSETGVAALSILLRTLMRDTDFMSHLNDNNFCKVNDKASEGSRSGQQWARDGDKYAAAAVAYEIIKKAIEIDAREGNKHSLTKAEKAINKELALANAPAMTTPTPAKAAPAQVQAPAPAKPTPTPAKKSGVDAVGQWAENLISAAQEQAPSLQVTYG